MTPYMHPDLYYTTRLATQQNKLPPPASPFIEQPSREEKN